MGIINHNAVIATTWKQESVPSLKEWISTLNPDEQALFVDGPVVTNGYQTFVMLPDGSKEGWEESDKGDLLRKRFIERLKKETDGYSSWTWIEVGFGEYGQQILNGNS